METIRGKYASHMNHAAWSACLQQAASVHIDLGTGDGRFVSHLARAYPRMLVIGVDACRENLVDSSRRAPANALFIIANACALPPELAGGGAHLTVNFPWGSLLQGLLQPDSSLALALRRLAQPAASLDLRLNAGALADEGYSLEQGTAAVQTMLAHNGFNLRAAHQLTAAQLKAFPTTWAKRLAFGRDPRAVHLSALTR